MKKQLTIIKIGGNVINKPAQLAAVLADFHAIEGAKLLVHGGGRAASQLSKKMGIVPNLINGRRVTDAATLEIVVMVYAGLINKQVVAQLQAIGCPAIGLSGADLNAIQAHKRVVKDIDYGWVGDIDSINHQGIESLLNAGAVPVFCPITHDKQGHLLNTNADTIAATLAAGLAALYQVRLVYCFEKQGVLSEPTDDDSVIPHITKATYQQYKTTGVITAGMIPKMDNAFMALENGTAVVVIGGLNAILDKTVGTKVSLR